MSKWLGNAIFAIIMLSLLIGAIGIVNRVARPQERVLPPEGTKPPSYEAIYQKITPSGLTADLKAFAEMGPRMTGWPGAEAAEKYLSRELAEAGYDVVHQPVRVTVPRTRVAELTDAAGKALPDVSLYPMLPNWFRTATTPPEGITGTLYAGEQGLAREFEGVPVLGNIILLPLGKPWNVVAGMGARAILYYETEESSAVTCNWNYNANASLNIPRFLVRGNIKDWVGRSVSLRARVDWQEVTSHNVVGILPPQAPQLEDELVIVNAYYDAHSYVPDLAHGAQQSCGTVAALNAARFLASEAASLRRHVIALFTTGHGQGLVGMRDFLQVLGNAEKRQEALAQRQEALEAAQDRLAAAEEAEASLAEPGYWDVLGIEAEETFWAARSPAARQAAIAFVRRVLDEIQMAALEAFAMARVNWVRAGMPVYAEDGETTAPTFAAYNEARTRKEQAKALLSVPLGRLKEHPEYSKVLSRTRVRARVKALVENRVAVLRERVAEATTQVKLAEHCAQFEKVILLNLDLTSSSGRFGLAVGVPSGVCQPADAELGAQVRRAAEGLDAAHPEGSYVKTPTGQPRFINLLRNTTALKNLTIASHRVPAFLESEPLLMAGHPSFCFISLDDNRKTGSTPNDTFAAIFDVDPEASTTPVDNLTVSTQVSAATISLLARGVARILPINQTPDVYTIRGRVVSQVGDSLTPNHPMPGAQVRIGFAGNSTAANRYPGFGRDLVLTARWDGSFTIPNVWRGFVTQHGDKVYLDAAVSLPETGDVTWALSSMSGEHGTYKVRGVSLQNYNRTVASAVVFRAAAVQVFPMADPNSLRPYAGFDFIEKMGLAAPKESKVEIDTSARGRVCFVEPDTRLYFTLKKGKKTNKALHEVRAFALNAKGPVDGSHIDSRSEIIGAGYLAADNPTIVNIELDVAHSMAQVNARRVAMQNQYGMADAMVLGFNDKAIAETEEALDLAEQGRIVEAKQLASQAVAYSSNIHPVIRKNAQDAVVGILFYLFLAIPFSFFMEKLLVGHPDIRYQLLYQGIIFLLFFATLWSVHPAFQLVRSSYMILLGFITFSLAIFVGGFVSARFSKNVSELNQRIQQRVETADVSRAGAAGTAFVLGLNNMRKRAVRTGLTVVTLILITFVMISFTSVSTDLVDIEVAVGKAPYTGILIRDRHLKDVGSALGALREVYGEKNFVVQRCWGGTFEVNPRDPVPQRAEFAVRHELSETRIEEAIVHGILGLSVDEPKVMPLAQIFEKGVFTRWFESEAEEACFLPRLVADQLRLEEEAIRAGEAKVKVGGTEYTVLGTFNPERLDTLLDLDGQSLLPIDIVSLPEPPVKGQAEMEEEESDVPEDIPRLSSEVVMITPTGAMPQKSLTVSVAVALMADLDTAQPLDYAGARKKITSYLERSGEAAYYGIEQVAFYGGRFRMGSLEGFLDLLLPILLSALTVLNTMRGSVYERRSELYVFNAVGLAPNHIAFLFMAEACVYAVVGAVGGYLLAQGVGTGLETLGWKESLGLTMNYSSLSVIIVTVVIMLVVLISSIFPARMAAQLAAPSETMTRERKAATGDVMEFDLPFTFNRRDRIAIIPYFVDWFENFGEGSSGEFFCSPPACRIWTDDTGQEVAPCVTTTTWLKPYDLGVSQQVDVVVRHEQDTGDNVATIIMTRKSGDRESWERCCHAFIGLLRKRFLTWRAVGTEDRAMLFERGRELLKDDDAIAGQAS